MVGNVQEPLLASLDAPLPAPIEAPAEIRHRTPGPAAPCPYRPRVPSRSSNQARIGLGYTPVGCGAGMRAVAIYSVPLSEGRRTCHQLGAGSANSVIFQGTGFSFMCIGCIQWSRSGELRLHESDTGQDKAGQAIKKPHSDRTTEASESTNESKTRVTCKVECQRGAGARRPACQCAAGQRLRDGKRDQGPVTVT